LVRKARKIYIFTNNIRIHQEKYQEIVRLLQIKLERLFMIRSVSTFDFDLALKVIHLLASKKGLSKDEIIKTLKMEAQSAKITDIITNFNERHLDFLYSIKEGRVNKYYLKNPNEKIPPLNTSEKKKKEFWQETLLNFPLYREVIQSYSVGNSVDKVVKIAGITKFSIKIITSWALYVGDLEKIKTDYYRVKSNSVEELLNRIAVCQLGMMGCLLVEREKQIEESGLKIGTRADVYGLNKRDNKEYYIESESSAKSLNKGIEQVNNWRVKEKNVEKWVLIPKETLKDVSFETLKKKYVMAQNRGILIKLGILKPNISNRIITFTFPGHKDLPIFLRLIDLWRYNESISINRVKNIIKNPKTFMDRMINYGLMEEKEGTYSPTFSI